MRSQFSLSAVAATLAAAATLGVLACSSAPSEVSHESMHEAAQASAAESKNAGESAETSKLITQLHAATARYHSTQQATKAGYAVASPCVAHPTLGGMGYHWVNQAMVDPVFDPMNPEAVLYAPDAQGKMKKVAVEFLVINVGQPRPYFGDHPFDINGSPIPVPHWSLHVWVDQENPAGVFTPFNPTVVCP